ncbi:unknown [Cryptophlebia leucotreta granulovirus]|uniref:Uncharacterized protein n=1 Tax=Cryptophlebia leucotreta granulosis virus TaxID=35254 RepID=Q7T5P1_GVCL|nr:hypothetical protein [Cryptophlebia leucotreta granulovirus]AAQ21643.1 unknown [Cryptophlebia leucotreta granulovirus]
MVTWLEIDRQVLTEMMKDLIEMMKVLTETELVLIDLLYPLLVFCTLRYYYQIYFLTFNDPLVPESFSSHSDNFFSIVIFSVLSCRSSSKEASNEIWTEVNSDCNLSISSDCPEHSLTDFSKSFIVFSKSFTFFELKSHFVLVIFIFSNKSIQFILVLT